MQGKWGKMWGKLCGNIFHVHPLFPTFCISYPNPYDLSILIKDKKNLSKLWSGESFLYDCFFICCLIAFSLPFIFAVLTFKLFSYF